MNFGQILVKPIAACMLVFVLEVAAKAQACETKPAGEYENAVCASMTVTFRRVTTKEITGVVTLNDRAFAGAIVELYRIGDSSETPVPIAKVKTGADGRFCFPGLRRGSYRLRAASPRFEFMCTEIEVKVTKGTKRLIFLPLQVGI